MQAWCTLTNARIIPRGDFHEARLVAHSGSALHLEGDWLATLAKRLMAAYEGRGSATLLVLDRELINRRRTRHHYRRLFDFPNGGTPTEEFRTVVSEALGLWIEEEFENILCAEVGSPHNNEPVYDLFVLWRDARQRLRLRVVQVKATEENLQGNANAALQRFRDLEAGYYDAEFNTRLDVLLERCQAAPDPGDDGSALIMERTYRVTLVHAEPRDTMAILTTYDSHVPGATERRSARLVEIAWDDFWSALGGIVHGQLT